MFTILPPVHHGAKLFTIAVVAALTCGAAMAAPDSDALQASELPAGPAPIAMPEIRDADLATIWGAWKAVEASPDFEREAETREAILDAKYRIDAQGLDGWAMAMMRSSREHADRGDTGSAVEIAIAASQLAPDLPGAQIELARAYFRADPTEIERVARALKSAYRALFVNVRSYRPLVGNVSAIAVLGLLATAIALVFVLFLRRARYAFFDFHLLFPRGAARWQTGIIALALLSLPLVFRLGWVAELLLLFAVVAAYLPLRERIVALLAIAILGGVPRMVGSAIEGATFAGTAADDLYRIERGSHDVEPLVAEWEAEASAGRLDFAGWYVLGRHALRRGQLDAALQRFTRAQQLRPNDLGTRVNLGIVFFLQGDVNNARIILEGAVKERRDPIILYDLARVYQRRFATLGDASAGEQDKATQAFSAASALDPSLLRGVVDEKIAADTDGHRLVRTYPLGTGEMVAQVDARREAQREEARARLQLLGDVPESFAPWFPGIAGIGIVLLGGLGRWLNVARPCFRCGNPVSRRADPDLKPMATQCSQCTSVFSDKSIAVVALARRKTTEIGRRRSRLRLAAVALSLWSGLGHLFSGFPVRGAILAFVFALLGSALALRGHLLRPEYGVDPMLLLVVPLAFIALVLWALTLRAIARRN